MLAVRTFRPLWPLFCFHIGGVIVPFSRSNPFGVVVGRFLRTTNPIFSIQEKITKT